MLVTLLPTANVLVESRSVLEGVGHVRHRGSVPVADVAVGPVALASSENHKLIAVVKLASVMGGGARFA